MLSFIFPKAYTQYASFPVLGKIWDGFCEWLHNKGYPIGAIRRRVQASRLIENKLGRLGVRNINKLTESTLLSLIPPPIRWTEQIAGSLIRSLIMYLKEKGDLAPEQSTPTSEQISAYCKYLEEVRGLAQATVERHEHIVHQFLQFLRYDKHPNRLHDLTIVDVDKFIARKGKHLGRASMQKVTAIMRSFLKFMATKGVVQPSLETQIDSPRCFRGERLPRALSWKSVKTLLRSVNRKTIKGRRDYAILLMIATYGLRANEIAALKLDHILWKSKKIEVPRSKIGTSLILPLTDEVATALLDYLQRGRGISTNRNLFLRVRIPYGPIKSTAVGDVFDVWASRAGIKLPKGTGGTHCLRHSLAVQLLRRGTSVKTIGDLLGHRSAESTCIYLRLNVKDLRDVALPLPKSIVREEQK
jgi:site-specific recombinase XerD